ncbi:MAG TPA: SDR family oxidoreductase [Thermoanaerobaculia bacterium]|nr:SDR family oxidoreductase [Thermoanaerobaculia bacterium]
MQRTTEERVAVVTGGSRGIGKAIVRALAGDGWQVFFCSRSAESVDAALEELGGSTDGGSPQDGPRVRGRAVDVRDEGAVDAFVAWVLEEAGRIDCLVNNAGLGRFGSIDELSGVEWREVIETNLSGAFYCIRAAAPAMRRQGSGWILNIASLAGKNPFAGGAAYNASKFGMVGMSEAAMLDLRHDGVRVTAILPGSVDTDFHSRKERQWMLHPDDVARTVLDLLAYPARALPSQVEIRPSQPPRK